MKIKGSLKIEYPINLFDYERLQAWLKQISVLGNDVMELDVELGLKFAFRKTESNWSFLNESHETRQE